MLCAVPRSSGAVQESPNAVCSPMRKWCSSGVSECCVQSRGQVVHFGSLRMLCARGQVAQFGSLRKLCAVPWSSVGCGNMKILYYG